MRQQYKNNKLKMIAPARNDEFELPDGSYSMSDKLELQTPKTMKLFGSTKKSKDKTKNEENVPGLAVVEVVLVQCNLVDHQYEEKSQDVCSYHVTYALSRANLSSTVAPVTLTSKTIVD